MGERKRRRKRSLTVSDYKNCVVLSNGTKFQVSCNVSSKSTLRIHYSRGLNSPATRAPVNELEETKL